LQLLQIFTLDFFPKIWYLVYEKNINRLGGNPDLIVFICAIVCDGESATMFSFNGSAANIDADKGVYYNGQNVLRLTALTQCRDELRHEKL